MVYIQLGHYYTQTPTYQDLLLHAIIFVFKVLFASGVGFPLYPEMFCFITTILQTLQDHCGRCRIRTWYLCLRSLVRYQFSHRKRLSIYLLPQVCRKPRVYVQLGHYRPPDLPEPSVACNFVFKKMLSWYGIPYRSVFTLTPGYQVRYRIQPVYP